MKPVHFSQLKHMAQSPAHYYQAVNGGWASTGAQIFGRGAHAMILDQPYAVFDGKVRRGKEWEAFKEENHGVPWLSRREADQCKALADAVADHREASRLIFGGNAVREQKVGWMQLGRECAGTPDVRNTSYIVDLKTTKSSHPERFMRDATWRSYHAQLAWYLDGVALSGLGKPTEAYVVAVESTPPHTVTVFRLTERAIDQGRRLCRIWLERVIGCERDGYWPGYCESVVDFDVDGPLELEFGDGDEDEARPLGASIEEMDAAF